MENVNFGATINLRPSPLKSLIAIALGTIFVFASDMILKYLVITVGISLIITGSLSLITFFKRGKDMATSKLMPTIESGSTILFGLILVLLPTFFISVLMILLGIVLLLAAIDQLSRLLKLRKIPGYVVSNWTFIAPILLLLASIMIILNPFGVLESILIITFGVSLLFYGTTSLISYFIIKGSSKQNF